MLMKHVQYISIWTYIFVQQKKEIKTECVRKKSEYKTLFVTN